MAVASVGPRLPPSGCPAADGTGVRLGDGVRACGTPKCGDECTETKSPCAWLTCGVDREERALARSGTSAQELPEIARLDVFVGTNDWRKLMFSRRRLSASACRPLTSEANCATSFVGSLNSSSSLHSSFRGAAGESTWMLDKSGSDIGCAVSHSISPGAMLMARPSSSGQEAWPWGH